MPEIEFINVDAEEIETNIVTRFEELSGTTLSEADPRRKFIQAIVYQMVLLLNNIDYTAKQRLLAYASDDFLDHIGAKKNVTRLAPKHAVTTIRFEVNPIQNSLIPKGTELSVNGVYFETLEDIQISPGNSIIEVAAQCSEPGVIGNGFLPGQIKDLVNRDLIPFVTKAENIVKSYGGADWEDDESYAERIRQSNERYSTAGPSGAYEYFAKSANQLISDVRVDSPSDGVIEIRPLLEGGELPTESIIDQVRLACSSRTVRPLTDNVIVLPPETVSYDLDVVYHVERINEVLLNSIHAKVSEAINDYINWQKSKLGRGIDAGELISRIKAAGASRVDVFSPVAYISIEPYQVAKEGAVNVTFGGVI
ncbi:baseplate J/gp47 family protein [Mesobacillus thioparans]|uniref:baseplate assembly protein n=1 Tax=Mesobacillus thioparans TaxID=370439 RepID=UPI0039F104DB